MIRDISASRSRRRIVGLLFIGARLAFGLSALAQTTQRGFVTEENEGSGRVGHRYVVAIGIDNYANWPHLATAVNDAVGFSAILRSRFGYEDAFPPLTEKQATRDNIISLIDDDLRSKLKPDDDLVVFFAGHGTTRVDLVGDIPTKIGFLVPYDAHAAGQKERWSDYVEADEFLRKISGLPARHILVILDSCHSGLALGGSFSASRGSSRYLKDMQRNVSRTVITSALGDQTAADSGPIPDHSLFTGLLIHGLESGKADDDGGGWVSSLHLGEYVQHEVALAEESAQTPAFGSFYRGDAGDLVLSAPVVPKPIPPPAPKDSFVVMNAPAGAEIHIDQQSSGHSTGGPYRIKVDPGPRTIEVFLAGYQPWRQTIPVEPGKQADVEPKLIPLVIAPPPEKNGFVVMNAPAGAEIHVDQQASGHSTGSPFRIKVDPGQRVIEVFLNGFQPWKQTVAVEPGKSAELVATLTPVPPPVREQEVKESYLVMNAPAGAEIHVDQQASGHSTGGPYRIKVDAGDRVIEVFLNGYKPWKQTVAVDKGKQAEVVANLEPIPAPPVVAKPLPKDSFITMNAPAGAEIHVDQLASGHSTGSPYRIKVDPGQRVLEVFLAGYEPWKQTVSVDVGKQQEVTASLVPVPISATPRLSEATSAVSEEDKKQIQELLDRYSSGYDQKDLKIIQAVWPSIPQEKLKNIKDFLRDKKTVELKLSIVDALPAGRRITVDCIQTLSYEGVGKPKSSTNPITLYVVKRDAGWEIDFVPNA